MRKTALGMFLGLGLLVSCAASGPASRVAPRVATPLAHAPAPEVAQPSRASAPRLAGDFVVHLLSGSFRKQPALFSERVVAEEAGGLIIEYRLEDNDGARAIRAHFDANGEVTRVSRLLGTAIEPGTLADYEALLAAASVVPDENEGFTASSRGTCTVGPSELDCETKRYRVRLGDQEAELGITQSRELPGRDLTGEITSADGTVIYRSHLIEFGNDAPKSDSLAIAEPAALTPAPAR